MGLLFCVRDNKDISYFKEFMISFTKVCYPESGLLGTGYISEYIDSYGKEHFISKETNLLGFNIIDSFPKDFDLTLIGIHSGKTPIKTTSGATIDWYENYKRLVGNICGRSKPIKVTAFYDKNGRWHAKMFFLLKNQKPIVGIIGSSNLTEPAFSSPYDKFNIESDMILWSDDYENEAQKIINKMIEKIKNENDKDEIKMSGVFSASFTPMWEGDSVQGRLETMYEQVTKFLPKDPVVSTKEKIDINEF